MDRCRELLYCPVCPHEQLVVGYDCNDHLTLYCQACEGCARLPGPTLKEDMEEYIAARWEF